MFLFQAVAASDATINAVTASSSIDGVVTAVAPSAPAAVDAAVVAAPIVTDAAVTAAAPIIDALTTAAPAAAHTGINVAGALADAGKFVNGINWAVPTWDLFIVLFFVVTVFLYGISLGRDRIIVILMSIYMALAVVSNAPFLTQIHADININQYGAFKVTTFIGLFILLFFLLSRSALLRTFGNLAAGTWWQVFMFSIMQVGLLVSIVLSLLPADAVGHLTPITRQIFTTEGAKFGWIVAPIIGMVFMKNEAA